MKKLFAITVLMSLAWSGFAQQLHYDFSKVVESGQTLYFLKRDYAPQEVWVTYPCYRDYYANGDHITTYYYGYEKPAGDLVIPSTVTHNDTVYTVTRIDFSTFYECTDITSVVFPNTMTFIGQRAFLSCHGLTGEIVIPDSVTIIGTNAFFDCDNITSVVFGSNLSEIRSYSFAQCYSLEHISKFPESLTKLDDGAFDRCGVLCDSIIIPPQVTTIGELAFANCQIPSVVISEGVTTIKRGAFSGCPIGELHIPSSLVSISPEDNAFGEGAFNGCNKLRSITVDEANPVYDSRNNCNALIETATNKLLKGSTSTIIPDGITVIGQNAFNLDELESITLPSSVERLERGAFCGCNSLSTITLPSSVSYIGESALACSGLTSIICKADIPPTAFNEVVQYIGPCISFLSYDYWVDRNIPVHIPFGTTEAYQNAEGWDYFNNFIEEEPIIYRDFEPDSILIYWHKLGPVWIDLDANGEANELKMQMWVTSNICAPEFITGCSNIRICTIEQNSINMILSEVAEENWQTFIGWSGGNTLGHYNHYGFRIQREDGYYYGWFETYNRVISAKNERQISHFGFDRTAYCTIPNYPLRWGQTSMDISGMEGAEWYYEILNDDGSTTYQHLECVGDTLIERAGKRPKVIVRSNTHYNRDTITEVTHEYVYEENGKVYWWNKDLQEFTTLYDLTANTGDEWEIKVGNESLIMHVDTVESVEYEGNAFTILRVSDVEGLFSGNIVCGIGHLTSFFPERLMTRDKRYRVEGMRCYWINGELVFKYGERDCDEIYIQLHDGVDENGPSTGSGTFAVYPNPAAGVLFVETQNFASLPDQTYRITNLMGQTLLQGTLTAENQQIDITDLPSGMYFISVDGQTVKFVVR